MATVDETRLTTNESVGVTVRVRNVGERADTSDTELRIDGGVVATEPVSLGVDESETVRFEHRFDDRGVYAVAVGSSTVANVTVLRSDGNADPVEVVDTALLTDWVRRGYNTSVRATVVNPGNESATSTLTVTVDGDAVATESVELAPNERSTLRIEFPARAGVVAIDGLEAGRLSVGGSRSAADPAETTTRAAGPGFGFGLLVPLVACFVAAALVRTRGTGE